MQIDFDLHKNECNLKSKDELFDVNKNIECGIKILKNNYYSYCDADGRKSFRSKVDYYCDNNPSLNEKYKSYSYESDCWNMALRAYNGLGCEKGNPNYVEDVRNNIKEQGFN